MRRATIVEGISCLLALLFFYAAVSKLFQYEKFEFQFGKSPYTTTMAGIVAWALPLGEILVVVALAFNKTRLLGLYASLFLMLMFTAYIYAILNFSYDIPCSCGGILSQMSWNQHFIFNILFTLLALTAVLLYKDPEKSTLRPLPISE